MPVTLLHIPKNVIIGSKKKDANGYDAKILAAFEMREKYASKPHVGRFPKPLAPHKKIIEIRAFEDKQVGDSVGVEIFENVPIVDVIGLSKGRGFQGVMRRYGAKGGPAGHGSKFHRVSGSIGQGGTPARFRKGSRMAGRMGSERVTVQNLRVVSIDAEADTIMVRGAVPGANGSRVLVRFAVKKQML